MRPLYELLLDDEEDFVYAISLVSEPAIQSDWVYFNKEKENFSTVSEERRIVFGSILIPDRKILRLDQEGNPYDVYISKDTVKKAAHLYLQKKLNDSTTLEHEKPVQNISLIESWIKESEDDKSTSYGIDAPIGSWVGMMKIEDDEIWNEYIKTGKMKGFSIEALFSQKYKGISKEDMDLFNKPIDELSDEEADIVLSTIKEMMENPSVTSTYPGEKAENDEYISEALLSDLKELIEWFKENVKNK